MTGDEVTLTIDGAPATAPAGTTVGALLHARGGAIRHSPRAGGPRGLYCGMGVCFECQVRIDGVVARACLTPVAEGMVVETGP